MQYKKLMFTASAPLTCAVTVGLVSTYSSTATESMKSSFLKPDDNQVSWIGSFVPLGAILGGIVAGYFSDKIGRKGVMMLLSVFLLFGWLLIAYAPSIEYVYAGRFVTGFCSGVICVVTPMYIVEIAIPELRGNLGCRFQLYICFGIIFVSLVGKYQHWQMVAIYCAAFSVFSPFCMLFLPESPQWLLMKGKQEEAINAMRFFYGDSSDATSQLYYEGQETDNTRITFRDLFQPTVYKPALLSIALMIFQQFSGSNAILYYTVSIFKESQSSIDPVNGNLIVAIFMCSFTLLSTFLMDKLGRKKSLIISSFVMCVTLNIFSTYLYLSQKNPSIKTTYGWVPLLCLLVYISAFSIGIGPMPWLMMSEMSPRNARGLICGLGTAFSWTFAFIVTKTFVNIEHAIKDYGAYWIYSCFCLLCCIFTIFILPETKGKTLEEIQAYFAGEPPMSRLQEPNVSSINNSDD